MKTQGNKTKLSAEEQSALLGTLKTRFEKNKNRHQRIEWASVESRLHSSPEKLWSLYQMEQTGGEPDVISYDENFGEFIFYDCSPESPKGRRSVCYDRAAQESRKKYPPANNAVDMAAEMGIELLSEQDYLELQRFGPFDSKTSSWLKTPSGIRKHGGAIFGDFRYGQVFVYHNGAQSYYAARGFRGKIRV